jgi:hypothetical protein
MIMFEAEIIAAREVVQSVRDNAPPIRLYRGYGDAGAMIAQQHANIAGAVEVAGSQVLQPLFDYIVGAGILPDDRYLTFKQGTWPLIRDTALNANVPPERVVECIKWRGANRRKRLTYVSDWCQSAGLPYR